MDNPFDYLEQEREQRDREEEETRKREELAEAELAKREEKLVEQRTEAAWEYHDIVSPTLEQLKQAAYPEDELGFNIGYWRQPRGDEDKLGSFYYIDLEQLYEEMSVSEVSEWYPSWQLGFWHENRLKERKFVASVAVHLMFDDNNKPSGFKCWRRTENIEDETMAGLSQVELIKALKQLHPPGSTLD